MKKNNDLIKDITEHLDQSVALLDPDTLSQIRTARYNAIEQKRHGFMSWALPAGGIAAAALILFAAVNFYSEPGNKTVTQVAADKTVQENPKTYEIKPEQIEFVEILSSDQQLDLYENLEFYAWLSENENIPG